MNSLDMTDWRILHELQQDGRMTNVELAKRIGISAPPCLRRVRALEKSGIIEGYCALLNEEKTGYEITAFANVGLNSQSEQDLKKFEEQVNQWPIVRECYMMSGEVDFILKCVAKDLNHFQTFLMQELTTAPNVDNVKTALTIRRSKFSARIPIEQFENSKD